DIPGVDNRERAIKIAQDQAFLEFQITDKTNAFEKALPRLDALAKEKGFGGAVASATPTTQNQSTGLNGLLTAGKDTTKVAAGKKTAADSVKADSVKTDSATL